MNHLAAEKLKMTHDMLSPYSQSVINQHSWIEKFAPNLNDKIKYVLYYDMLRLYLELGMDLLKFTECFNSVNQHGSNHILILIQ